MPEWFSNPQPNLYVSDSGFSVEVLSQTGMRYKNGERGVLIDSEVMSEPGAMLAYESSIKKWDPPHESDPLDENDREIIIANLKRAFEFYGYKLHVV